MQQGYERRVIGRNGAIAYKGDSVGLLAAAGEHQRCGERLA
jgi:hypothetical protein